MSKENGKFEQAIANIENDSNPWCATKRPHRDALGWAAMLSKYYGPGNVELSQFSGQKLFYPEPTKTKLASFPLPVKLRKGKTNNE